MLLDDISQTGLALVIAAGEPHQLLGGEVVTDSQAEGYSARDHPAIVRDLDIRIGLNVAVCLFGVYVTSHASYFACAERRVKLPGREKAPLAVNHGALKCQLLRPIIAGKPAVCGGNGSGQVQRRVFNPTRSSSVS